MMMLQVVSLWCVYLWSVEGAVLDPSLYLSPVPPLTDTASSIPPAALWSRSATMVPSQVEEEPGLPILKRKPNPMEKAKLFWPKLRSSHYNVGTGHVQIPLTFRLTGTYGKYAPGNIKAGIIGTSYGTVSEITGTAASALTGGIGNYRYGGLRIYGGESGPTWSGWGNGKWGHYGKG